MGATLTLHAGAAEATRAAVLAVPTPEATETWQPVPHGVLIDGLLSRLGSMGLNVVREQHGLARAGQRWFGVFDLEAKVADRGYSLALGLRNSHDMSFASAVLMGSRVWICDNLALSGEVRVVRKHTTEILNDLPGVLDGAMVQLSRLEVFMHARIEHYRRSEIESRDAAYFLVRSVTEKTLPVKYMKPVWEQWQNPKHEDFAPRTAWSLFNAYTEVLKASSFTALPARTQRLHVLMDQFVGVPTFKTFNDNLALASGDVLVNNAIVGDLGGGE